MTSAHPEKPSERVADGFMTGVNCTVSPITKADLLAELERLSKEAQELVAKARTPEEKQRLCTCNGVFHVHGTLRNG